MSLPRSDGVSPMTRSSCVEYQLVPYLYFHPCLACPMRQTGVRLTAPCVSLTHGCLVENPAPIATFPWLCAAASRTVKLASTNTAEA